MHAGVSVKRLAPLDSSAFRGLASANVVRLQLGALPPHIPGQPDMSLSLVFVVLGLLLPLLIGVAAVRGVPRRAM
jgi:hypothetical protein